MKDNLPTVLAVVDKIEEKYDLSWREWAFVVMYIVNTKCLRKRGSESKTLHHIDVITWLMVEIGKTRGIFISEGESQTPTK